MTDNDRRLLETTAAAMKLLLDTVVHHRISLVDRDRAQVLSAEIGAALTQPGDEPTRGMPIPPAPQRSALASPLLMGWIARRRGLGERVHD